MPESSASLTAVLASRYDWSCPAEVQTGRRWEGEVGMRAGFLLPLSRSSFPWAGCPCSGMRGPLSPPTARSFSRDPSLPVKLGGWWRGATGWGLGLQVPGACTREGWERLPPKAGRPALLTGPVPPASPGEVARPTSFSGSRAWDFPHLPCLALVALILPCVSSSPSGSHVLQGDSIMSWWCHLANAIRKFPQDFSCFAGRQARLPGHPRCSSAHSFFSPGWKGFRNPLLTTPVPPVGWEWRAGSFSGASCCHILPFE